MATHYAQPKSRVEVDHDGSTYDLSASTVQWDLYREINAVDYMTVLVADEGCDYFENKIHGWWDDAGTIKNDTVKLYCNYSEVSTPLTTTDLRFYGFVEGAKNVVTQGGEFIELQCRSYFRCLLDLLVAQEYGSQSTNPTLDTIQEIIQDAFNGIIDLWVEKVLGGAVNTGYTVSQTYVENIAGTIKYITFPYKPVRNALNDLMDLLQAIKTDSAAGMHWIGRTIESPADTFTPYLAVAEVDDHEHAGDPPVEDIWPTWWSTDEAGSTLVVKTDMILNDFHRRQPEANYILYFGNCWVPGNGDYWTEETAGNSVLWSSGVGAFTADCDSIGVGAVGGVEDPVVGITCLQLEPTNAPNVGYAFYPATQDLGWNLENISSPTNIPHLVWYEYQTDVFQFNYLVQMATDNVTHAGGANDDYFIASWFYMTPIADKWYRVSVPIGPHWARDPTLHDAGDDFYWTPQNNADWADINMILFSCGDNNAYDRCIDGLHIEAQVIRGAYLSNPGYTKIKMIQDHVAKDDSLDAADDSGTMAQLAYAELLRAARRPIQGTIAIPGKPTILAGQKAHIHAGQHSGGFRINKAMMFQQHHLHMGSRGLISYLTLTDDLLNGRPMSPMDEYNLIQGMTQPSAQNRTMSSIKSWPIDITHTVLAKSYAFNDFF